MDTILGHRRPSRSALGLLIALSPLLLLLLALSPAAPAQAGGAVTDCTEMGLHSALAGGGLITFNCGGVHAPATILLSSAANIITATTVDGSNGGNLVTLDGQGGTRIFFVNTDAQLTLANLILTNGAAVDGSCLFTSGALELDNVEVKKVLAFEAGLHNYLKTRYIG